MSRRARRRCVALALLALCGVLALAAWVTAGGTPSLDDHVNESLRPLRRGVVGDVMLGASWIGYASRIVPLVVLVDLVLVARRAWSPAAVLSLSALLGLVAFATIKRVVERPRPLLPDHVVGGWSMPSGHATTAFAIAVSLLLAIPALRRGRWSWCGIALVVWAALTATSRVVLGVHYLTDVVAGALLGTACAILAATAVGWWRDGLGA